MLTAYLTLLLLIVHYFLIYNPLKKGRGGTSYTNPVDGRLLTSIRGTFIWEPSKRFEYALERVKIPFPRTYPIFKAPTQI